MDTTPLSGVDELDEHLDELLQDDQLPLNAKLFDNVQLQLTESNTPPLIPRLLPKLIAILEGDSRDPSVTASLSTKLLGPVTFPQALSLSSPESLIHALRAPEPSVNTLAMTVLEKAARTPQDAARLAEMPALVAEFLSRWLLSPHAQVGAKGRRVLGDLLDTDCPLPPPSDPTSPPVQMRIVQRRRPGLGKLWGLLLGDSSIYGLLVDICSGRRLPDPATNGTGSRVEDQVTLAQGRLLDVLPRLGALDLRSIAESDLPTGRPVHATNGNGAAEPDGRSSAAAAAAVAAAPVPSHPRDGLLHFAALHMVDKRDDLMHLNLIEFFEGFVSLMRVTEYSAYKVETIRALLRRATSADERLTAALQGLPDRTVPEEADELRSWLREVLPRGSVRVSGSLR